MRLGIKMAILAAGKTQRTVSVATGIPENRLSDIVRGWREPRQDEMERLAVALDRPVDVLFGEVSEPQVART